MKPRIHSHTPFWATWSPLTRPPLCSEVIQWKPPSLSDSLVELSGLPSSVRDHSTLQPPLLQLRSFDSWWLFSLISLPLSSSLTCTFSFSPNQWVILVCPCTHSVTLSHSASHFQVPVFFVFFLTGGNKISSSSHVVFSFPPHLSLCCSLLMTVPVFDLHESPILSLRRFSLGKSGVGGVVLVVVIPWRAGLVSPNNALNYHLKCQSLGCHSNLKPTAKACQWSGESVLSQCWLSFIIPIGEAINWESKGFSEKLVLFWQINRG